MNFLGNHNLLDRASEHVLFELFYLKIFPKYIECFFASRTEVTYRDFVSLFCLTIQGQHHEHPITLQGCDTKMLSNRSGESRWPIQNGPRLLQCLFICSSWICLFSFLCIPHQITIIFVTLAHSNGCALSDILFLIYYELGNYTPRLVKIVYPARIYRHKMKVRGTI